MGDGRRWGLVAGALLVLVGRLGFMLVSTTLRLTLLTRVPSNGCLKRHGNAPWQPGHGTLLFQTIWMMRTASQKDVGQYGNLAAEVSTAV